MKCQWAIFVLKLCIFIFSEFMTSFIMYSHWKWSYHDWNVCTLLLKKIVFLRTTSGIDLTHPLFSPHFILNNYFKFCSCDTSSWWMCLDTLLSVWCGVRFIRMPEHSSGQIGLHASATVLHLAGGGDIPGIFKHPCWMVRSQFQEIRILFSIASFIVYCYTFTFRLSTNKQNKVYLPEEPFPHAFLVKNARLKHYTSTYAEGFSNDYRQPCVVFCGHPSLRFGDAVHFVQLWGNNPLHTIIFTGILHVYLCFLSLTMFS